MNGKMIEKWLVVGLLLILIAPILAPGVARGGWIVEWTNTALSRNGERMTPESATMYIDKGRVRLEQPTVTTVIDYEKGLFTVLNSQSQFFWSGKVDEYVSELTKGRSEAMRQRSGPGASLNYGMRKVDEKSLPLISIKKTDLTREIAGHQTNRYEIHGNSELFQEIWLAEDIDMKRDLNPEKFLDYQRKMSAAMLGRSAGLFNALHRSKDYAELLQKGFVLQSIVHHGSGGFEKKATAIRASDIAGETFKAPKSYRRVRLRDVFPTTEEQPPASGQ